ncbi:hypothetical protein C5O80_05340 [Burkholderia sp. SRS-46]|nr:hypothetical protein C5O80_05340 [Burkholderia sp. SRS-46]
MGYGRNDMSSFNNTNTGSIGGLLAGLALIAAGIGSGIHSAFLPGTARLGEFVAVGATMLGIFLIVYEGRELTRKWLR